MLAPHTRMALRSATLPLRTLHHRLLHSSATISAVMPYRMPAMSPTMESGGIVEWKVAPGGSFSAGDVLLEIETDKAQIDVEAQDDGQLVKVLRNNGDKDIPVGETIAYTAEPEDDLGSIDLAALTGGQAPAPESKKPVSESKKPAPITPMASTSSPVASPNKQQRLLPSVAILLAENGISREDAIANIPGTGLHGTLLKGDVLAYLGAIPADAASSIGAYVDKSTHLDLSGIEKTVLTSEQNKIPVPQDTSAPVQEDRPAPKSTAPPVITLEEDIKLSVPGSVSPSQLQASVSAFLKEAYQYAHLGDLSAMQSEHYDPLFEELVAPERRAARFTYSFELEQAHRGAMGGSHDDIFDLLAGSASGTATSGVAGPDEYVLALDVTVNNAFADSREKANLFMDYVHDLEDAQV